MREGLDRIVSGLHQASKGLDDLFLRKVTKTSHLMTNADGHPWIRVLHPMDEVRFIGITPNRGDGPIYLKLRAFLYAQYIEHYERLLKGKFFTFEGVALLRNVAYAVPSWERDLEREGNLVVVGYEATINISDWPDDGFNGRIVSLCKEFCLFIRAVVNGGADYEALPDAKPTRPAPAWLDDEAALEAILNKTDLSESETRALAQVRIGQSNYRKQLIERWGGCSVTECNLTDYLIASHIQAWGKCKTADERWDVDNGLLLIPNLDKLFDRGLISFSDEGKMLIHSKLSRGQMHHFNVDQNKRLRPHMLSKYPGILKYLKRHREINGFEAVLGA